MQSSKETSYFTPLLFTKKKDDQEQPSTSYTTPRPSRSPRSPSSAGIASGAGAQRRRSLTPTGSTALQAAEPPIFSLYSENSGQTNNKENLVLTLHEPDKDLGFQGLVLDAGQENVVTVFGFPNNRSTEEMVLQEFGKCGDILRYHTNSQSNWMHIQYGTKYEAQRALLKNGLVLSAATMIGVRPLVSQYKHLFDSPADAIEDSSMKIPSSSLKEQELSAKDVLLPVPPKTGWSKVTEFVFGL